MFGIGQCAGNGKVHVFPGCDNGRFFFICPQIVQCMCFHGQSCSIDASRVFIGYVVCPDMYIFSIDQPMVYPGVFCYGFCVRPFYFSGFFITDVFTFQCQVSAGKDLFAVGYISFYG